MTGAVRFAAIIAVPLAFCTWVGGARAAGGIGSTVAAERQMINVLRGEFNQAAYRRCVDERTHYQYPDVRLIPARLVHRQRVTWGNRLAMVRLRNTPHAVCWRSHFWAESWAGRCVTSHEGGLRTVSTPRGTWHGKWQMNADFERAYGAWFLRKWGRASNWPEWAQDVAGWRGYRARGGWWPWENSARSCGLL